MKKLEICYAKNSYNILHKTGVRVSMGDFNISEIFVFVNFLHTNSHELVKFSGRFLNKNE